MKKAVLLLFALVLVMPAAAAERLDLSDPEDAVKALRKIACSMTDGDPVTFWWTGSVYSRVAGEKDRHLFDYQAMNTRACRTVTNEEQGYGYTQVSKEILIYLDPDSGEIVRTWDNPWTGKEVEVVHIANDPVNMRYAIHARGRRGPFELGATFKEGRGWMSIVVPLFYPNPLAGDYQEFVGGTYLATEMFNFFFDEESLLDAATEGVADAHVSWARFARWLPWMEMGDRAGYVFYNGAGKRVASWDELPDLLKDEIRTNYPGFDVPPPLDDKRPNETSWSYFKKHVDAKRAEAAAKE